MTSETLVHQWASVMLNTALQGELSPESIPSQVARLSNDNDAEIYQEALKEILLEAIRVGQEHLDGSLYHSDSLA